MRHLMTCKCGIICWESQPKCAPSVAKADDSNFCQSRGALHVTSARDQCMCGVPWWGPFQDICTHFHKVWNIWSHVVVLAPSKKNEPLTPMKCGVRINLFSNSRTLINSPLMENCGCHACVKIEKGWKASWVSLTAAKLQEAPFGFLVPASSLSSQFSGRRARGLTSECFLGGRKEERKLGRKQRRNVWRGWAVYVGKPCNAQPLFCVSDLFIPESEMISSESDLAEIKKKKIPCVTNCQGF